MSKLNLKKEDVVSSPARTNPAAVNISLASRYNSRYPNGVAKVELGSVWTLARPTNESASKFPTALKSTVIHKPNRPYVVLTDEVHNRTTGLVTVVPSTTFSGRGDKAPLAQREKFTVEYDVPISKQSMELVAKYPSLDIYTKSYISCYGMFTVSIDRFLDYLHSISPENLQNIREVVKDMLSVGDQNSFQKFFPGYPVPGKK